MKVSGIVSIVSVVAVFAAFSPSADALNVNFSANCPTDCQVEMKRLLNLHAEGCEGCKVTFSKGKMNVAGTCGTCKIVAEPQIKVTASKQCGACEVNVTK